MYQYRILDLEFRNQFNETFCEHVIALNGKARFEQIFGQVNSASRDDYIFWWWVYEAEYPEPHDRLLAIRRLLHDPYENEVPAEQLEGWLKTAADYYFSNAQNANKSTMPSVVLANTCFKHGMNERGIDFLLKAVEKGLHANEKRASNDAIQSAMTLSKWHADREEWERSLEATQQWLELQEKLGRNTKYRNQSANWGQIHRIACLKQLGRSDEVAAELGQLTSRQFSISQLSNLARLLDDEEMYDESRVLWKRLCYQPGKDFRPFAAYSYPALIGLANIVLDNPEQGDPRWVESFLGYMLADNNDWYLRGSVNAMHPVVALLNFREQVNQAYAHRALDGEQVAVAVRHLERGLKARPGNVDNVVAFADKLTELEANDELDALFDIARQLHVDVLNDYPDSAMHHNNLAWLCAKSYRNLEEAREHATQATDLRPAEDTYWDTLAEVEFQLGNLERATELARKCFVMDPLYPHYQTQLKKFEAALEEAGLEAP